MDLPIFFADYFGTRTLIGVIAIIHVWINHAFAVGMMPLVVAVEWWAHRRNQPEWDALAYRILSVSFIVTTTVGALTGVGIWLSSALINPYAIGSLLRVFYWAWFTEWIVFVAEVALILVYFLTWKRMSGLRKSAHIRIGVLLGVMSWLTMAIIVAILGFMMNPDSWLERGDLLSAFANPIYLPQLLFRTAVALTMAGSLALALTLVFTGRDSQLRARAIRAFSGWSLFWLIPTLIGGLAYYHAIPLAMLGNMPVALSTLAWQQLYGQLVQATLAAIAAVGLFALWGIWQPQRARTLTWIVPLLLLIGLMGYFERAREFTRKPYVIGYYMYSNGIRVDDVPYLVKTGVLANSTWTQHSRVTSQNKEAAGRDLFMVLCSRCHTLNGINSIGGNLARMYPGRTTWSAAAIESFLKNIHGARPFMPPFIGTAEERGALAAYLATLANRRDIPPPVAARTISEN